MVYFIFYYCLYIHKWITVQILIILSFSISKDVRLPVQLQRAMAAEAEAAREARAKVSKICFQRYWSRDID